MGGDGRRWEEEGRGEMWEESESRGMSYRLPACLSALVVEVVIPHLRHTGTRAHGYGTHSRARVREKSAEKSVGACAWLRRASRAPPRAPRAS
jgi:hypothetical protein